MRRYSGYKEGCNSRGLKSDAFATEEPKYRATHMESDQNFKNICKKATDKINELIDAGALPRGFWNTSPGSKGAKRGSYSKYEEVSPTSRQYRKFRNKHGLAYEYGR